MAKGQNKRKETRKPKKRKSECVIKKAGHNVPLFKLNSTFRSRKTELSAGTAEVPASDLTAGRLDHRSGLMGVPSSS